LKGRPFLKFASVGLINPAGKVSTGAVMDAIKNISFSIALVVIGAIFILVGASGGIFFSNFQIEIDQSWEKGMLIVFGILMVGAAVLVEIRSKAGQFKGFGSGGSGEKPTGQSSDAENFFYTLDKKGLESFPELIKDAVSVKITARTIVNLLNQYGNDLEELGRSGCELKFLVVNPESDVSKSLYGINPEAFYNNSVATARHLERLKVSLGSKLQTRIINKAPTVSIMIIEKKDAVKGIVQIQFYLYSVIGRNRHIFDIRHGDKWFKMFAEEFNVLWMEGIEWDTKTFLERNLRQGT